MKRALGLVLLGVLALGGDQCGIAYVDWELVMSLAAAIITLGVLWMEHRRENRLDALAIDHTARIATLEAIAVDADALDKRIDAMAYELSARADRVDNMVALFEARLPEADALRSLCERIATLEARADHKPWTHTRRKDGKFASPDEVIK